ncbi:amidohydrolase [Alkalihalobacillus sp. 1P02AB]|uniref:amidohydrolase n=1 Tax=Alkalihalobacillus sp. 1P02AB TaxID=3132260 RepID=UPI0039A4013C
MKQQEYLADFFQENQELFEQAAERIWGYAELRFEETESSKLLSGILEREGFAVEKGIAGIETAFVASFGSEKPVISFLGEFDALSDLSQQAGITEEKPIVAGGTGHGCGHHLLGTASLAAALALKAYMKDHGLGGTVRFYGCPGEEGGSGKTFMAKEGVFADIDSAITWHPGTYNAVWTMETLANIQASFTFKGKASHAASAPHLGRSGLDAVELMNVGVNYLREHLRDEARVHYAITNTGGISPNVVQPEAEVLYLMRAPKIDEVKEIYERVKKIAEGAALMTGTEWSVRFDKACSNFVRNNVLEDVMSEELDVIGTPTYTEEEQQFAAQIQETLTEDERKQTIHEIQALLDRPNRKLIESISQKALIDDRIPTSRKETRLAGSTDVGDVSWIAPTVQCFTTCYTAGTAFHTWQMVSQGLNSVAVKGMMQAGLLMAATGLRLLQNPELVDEAKEEWRERLSGEVYQSPIPAGVQPTKINQ